MQTEDKVFCIGVWKSGTTSIGNALNILLKGKHCGWTFVYRNYYLKNNKEALISTSRNYISFDDSPWNCKEVIDIMANEYPNSKFILPIRDVDEWFESFRKWNHNDLRRGLVGRGIKMKSWNNLWSIVCEGWRRELLPDYDAVALNPISEYEKIWKNWYKQRNENLIKILGDRVLPIYFSKIKPLSWEPICKFLNKQIPIHPFPHLNKNK